MKNAVYPGFIAVIIIMAAFFYVWKGEIKDSNEKVLDMFYQANTKIELSHIMHQSIVTRQSMLLSMLVAEDPFEIDEKIMRFYAVAYNYRIARKKLFALPATEVERKLQKLLDQQTEKALPENNRAVEMFRTDVDKDKIIPVVTLAGKYQDELLVTLDKFDALQRDKDEQAAVQSRELHEKLLSWFTFFFRYHYCNYNIYFSFGWESCRE